MPTQSFDRQGLKGENSVRPRRKSGRSPFWGSALTGTDVSAIKSATEKVSTLSQELGASLYAANAASASEAPKADDGVEDAEIAIAEVDPVAVLTSDLQRLQADFQNYRKRVDKERIESAEVVTGIVLSQLLGALDDIDRAQEHGELTGGFKAFVDTGVAFDPHIHEALMHETSSAVTETQVTKVLRPGYKFKERVLRPAQVITITTRVPAGIKDGGKIKLKGRGASGPAGPGDLFIIIHVTKHPVFTRDGNNLLMTLPVTFTEAALGADIAVPTLSGEDVTVRLAPGTQNGKVLRVKVHVPQRLDTKAKGALEAFAELTKAESPRIHLKERAGLSGMHPQTLRQYDRMGLVSPGRASGRGRRYSLRDIASLRNIQRLVGDGINLAGIKRIMELESAVANMALEVAKLRTEVDALMAANPPRALVKQIGQSVVIYKEE
eukprot:gene1168-1184_t